MKFKGDIIITDPCYILKHSDDNRSDHDWDRCNYGQNMGVLGIKNFLTSDTEYGDWSCSTVKDSLESAELIAKLNEIYFNFFRDYNDAKVYKTAENRKKMLEEYEAKRAEMENDLILGKFCADAGLVSVFLLSEVLAYNPDFDYHINRPWTTTLIKDFDGDVEITHRDGGVSVVGKGNINFYTTQTGL
jgi:hypothetical protein